MNTELHGNEEKQRNKEEAFATDEHGIRIEKKNKGILTAKTQRAQRKVRMDPRIREGDQGSR